MSKRHKLSERTLHNLRRAERNGYLTYRYGSARPVTLPRIFTGQKRRNMVDTVMDRLRDWRLSPFEKEGATRAGVRQALILDGHGWHLADFEAEALIGEALHNMGAKRPSEAEAAPEYTIPLENCANCRGPLDEEDIANRRRFCSEECRTVMRIRRNKSFWIQETITARYAYEVARKEGIPERSCEWCTVVFKPATPDAATCSPEHAAKLREQKAGRALSDRVCPGCGGTFSPASHRERFCSQACHNFHTVESLPSRKCAQCNEGFQPTKTFMKYCSTKCGKKGYAQEVAAALPEKLCAHCDEIFKPTKSKQEFCSRSCASRSRVGKQASAFTCDEVKEAA